MKNFIEWMKTKQISEATLAGLGSFYGEMPAKYDSDKKILTVGKYILSIHEIENIKNMTPVKGGENILDYIITYKNPHQGQIHARSTPFSQAHVRLTPLDAKDLSNDLLISKRTRMAREQV